MEPISSIKIFNPQSSSPPASTGSLQGRTVSTGSHAVSGRLQATLQRVEQTALVHLPKNTGEQLKEVKDRVYRHIDTKYEARFGTIPIIGGLFKKNSHLACSSHSRCAVQED